MSVCKGIIEIKYSFYSLDEEEVLGIRDVLPHEYDVKTYGLNRYDEYFLPPIILISIPLTGEKFIEFTKTNYYRNLTNKLVRLLSRQRRKMAIAFSLTHNKVSITLSCITSNTEALKNFLAHIDKRVATAIEKINSREIRETYILVQHSDPAGEYEKTIII